MSIDRRFDTPYKQVCDFQPIELTKRVGKVESLDLGFVEDNVRTNARFGINTSGRIVDLRGRTRDKTVEARQLTVVTMSPWGPDDLMVIDLGRDRAPSLIDVPEPVLSASLQHQAHILGKFQEGGRTAYFGANHGMDLTGEGLQSLKPWHAHLWRFGENLEGLTPDRIKEIRKAQIWDEGVSLALGSQIGDRIQKEVLPRYMGGTVEADAMGFTIDLPGFTTQDIGKVDFVDKFLRPLSLIIHHKLREIHSAVFRSDLDDVVNYVLSRKGTVDLDWEHFNKFFERVQLPSGAPPHIVKLHEMDELGELRKTPGWAIGIQFNEQGAFGGVTLVTPNRSAGPVETFAVDLVRTENSISEEKMAAKIAYYDSCVEDQLKRVA